MNARRRPVEGWLTHPRLQDHPSEGHTNAVTVLRMVGTRHQHHAAEPIPFRSQPAPLRSIKPPRPGQVVMLCASCTYDCNQGRICTCSEQHHKAKRPADEPSPIERAPGTDPSALWWVVAVVVFCLLALAKVFMGPPQEH